MRALRWCSVVAAFLVIGGCPPKVDVAVTSATSAVISEMDMAVTSEDDAVIGVTSQGGPPGSEVEVIIDLPPRQPGETFSLKIQVEGKGRVDIFPLKEVYGAGDQVTLWAQPDKGFRFAGWAGDFSGDTNPLGVVVDTNLEITARFVSLPPPRWFKSPTVDLKINDSDEPLEFEVGAMVTAKWVSVAAKSIVASGGWSGAKPTAGEEQIGPLDVGLYVFSLTAANDFGSATDAVVINIKPPPGGPPQEPLQVEVFVPQSPSRHKVGVPVEFKLKLSGGLGPFRHKALFPDAQFFEREAPDREVVVTHTFLFPISPGENDGYGTVTWRVTDLGTNAVVVTQILIEVVP